jgi:hypothetical protein
MKRSAIAFASRRSYWGAHDADFGGGEHGVEGRGEFAVAAFARGAVPGCGWFRMSALAKTASKAPVN